jgi:hypothetical protein
MPIAGPGYYEARIKTSRSPLNSAFFLQILSGHEIDIAENSGGTYNTPEIAMQARSHTHWFPEGYKRENSTTAIVPDRVPPSGVGFDGSGTDRTRAFKLAL